MAYTLENFLDAPPHYLRTSSFPLNLCAAYTRRAVLCHVRPASLKDLLQAVEEYALTVPLVTAMDYTDSLTRRIFARWVAEQVYGDKPWPAYDALVEREKFAAAALLRSAP